MGLLLSINISNGGVPKRPLESCLITAKGLAGDRQRDLRYHGGPARAVCLYSQELIEALRAEGHPITAGSIGENLTVDGVAWGEMIPGARFDVGETQVELTDYAASCNNIAGSFREREFKRVSEKVHPGWSRLYARVLKAGTVRVGDRVARS